MINIQNTGSPEKTTASASQECRTIASIFALGMSFVSFLLSAGTIDQPRVEIFLAAGITLLIINFPSWILSSSPRTQLRADLLWAGVSTVLLFCIRQPAPIVVPYVLAVIGIVVALAGCVILLRCGAFLRRTVKTVVLASLYIFVVGQFVWGEGYRNPLDLLQLANTGSIHTDPAFHKAVIANLMTHGVCSTGMDGVPPFAYHYATHLFASRVGLLMDASPHNLVCIVMPIMLPSLLLYSLMRMLVVGCEWFSGTEPSTIASIRGHFLLLAGFGGFLPPVMLFTILNWNWSFTMDSQIMAMTIVAVSLLSFRALMSTAVTPGEFAVGSSPLNDPRIVVSAAVTIAALTATKVTVAHHYTLGMLYLILRCSGDRKRKLLISVVFAGTLVVCSGFFAVKANNGLYLSPLALWFERIPFTAWPLMLPVNTFFAFTYLFIRLYRSSIKTWSDFLLVLKDRRIIDVELILLISVTGAMLTGVFGGKLASNSIYYLCAAQFIAIVAAGILDLHPRVTNSRLALSDVPIVTTMSRVLFALLFLTALANSAEKWRDISRLNLQCRGDQFAIPLGSPAESGKIEMRVLLRQGKLSDAIAAALNNTKHTEERILNGDRLILGALAKLARDLTFQEKQTSVLWVPRTNRRFWDLPREDKRWLLPMTAVGIAAVAMIDGCPEEWEPIADGNAFGFSAYPTRPVTADTALSYPDTLAKARKLGFQWVLELKDSGEIVRYECR